MRLGAGSIQHRVRCASRFDAARARVLRQFDGLRCNRREGGLLRGAEGELGDQRAEHDVASRVAQLDQKLQL